MRINLNRLTLTNFKSHKELTIELGDINTITGTNGAGKSSIGDAIAWCLYGVDTMDQKLDPTPLANKEASTKVEMLLSVDEKQILLARTLEGKKRTAGFYVNEVPTKATPYGDLVKSLFDKTLFLSLFTPTFFATQHWKEQRTQLLRYVPEPLEKEVLEQLPLLHRNNLSEALQKRTLADLEKIHGDNKRKRDKEWTAQDGVMKHCEGRLVVVLAERDAAIAGGDTEEQLRERAAELQEEINGFGAAVASANAYQKDLNQQRSLVERLATDLQRANDDWRKENGRTIADTCTACGQSLTAEATSTAHDHKVASLETKKAEILVLREKGKTAEARLQELEATPVTAPDMTALLAEQQEVRSKILAIEEVGKVETDLQKEREKREVITKSLSESGSILEACQSFRAKAAEMMTAKVSGLFSMLTVRLFEDLKNGNEKETFEIEMHGVPYSRLSTAERIKAGLELIDVLSQQAGLVAPVFVDNAESVLRYIKPAGQLIEARVQDSELTIQTKQLEGVDAA